MIENAMSEQSFKVALHHNRVSADLLPIIRLIRIEDSPVILTHGRSIDETQPRTGVGLLFSVSTFILHFLKFTHTPIQRPRQMKATLPHIALDQVDGVPLSLASFRTLDRILLILYDPIREMMDLGNGTVFVDSYANTQDHTWIALK